MPTETKNSDVDEKDKIKQLLKQLKRSNTELERFAFVSSHDLQEPIRAIHSFAQLLQEDCSTECMCDTGKEYLSYILEATERLRDKVNSLLDYSRISNKNKIYCRCDLNKLMDNLLKDINAFSYIPQFHCDPLPTVMCEPNQISRLFQNMLSNAIKYQDQDRPLEVKIEVHEEENSWLFSVKDNGIGFDDKYKKQIFSVFKRLHTQEEISGTGIGLSISKRIVERHGGTIWAEPNDEHGATFFFYISKELENEPEPDE